MGLLNFWRRTTTKSERPMSQNETQSIPYGELVKQLTAALTRLDAADDRFNATEKRIDDVERLNHSQEATISAARATADEARTIAMANSESKGGEPLVSIAGDELHLTHPSGRLKFRFVQRDGRLDFIPYVDPI